VDRPIGVIKNSDIYTAKKRENHIGSKHIHSDIHHGFPEEFSRRFKNIADIDVNNLKYYYNLPKSKHTWKPGIHTNSSRTGKNWNKTWSGILDWVEKMKLSKSEAKTFLEARLRELARKERISKYNSEAVKRIGNH
jgi:rhs family protein